MNNVSGKTVLITGGAMGMGKAYVHNAVKEGAKNVVIWDLNEKAMQDLEQDLECSEAQIHTYKIDVSDTQAIYELAEHVINNVGPVDLLINNAGIVVSEDFIEHSPAKIDLTMQVNSIAPMHITRAFLPAMVKLEEAHIVNIASSAGFMYAPKIVTYCASKWASLGWSMGLRSELKQTHSHIKVTTVAPGHIDTGMFDGAHSSLMPMISVEAMVSAVWRGIKKDQALVVKPSLVRLIPITRNLVSIKTWDWIAKITGINAFMSGHSDPRK